MLFRHKSGYFFGNAAGLWYVFLLVGLFAIVSPFIMELEVPTSRAIIAGSVAVLAGIILKTNYNGLEIDYEQQRFRLYVASFGIKSGQWTPLPPLSHLVKTAKNVSSWNTPNGISPTFKHRTVLHTIALFDVDEQLVCFLQTENAGKAAEISKELSNKLGVSLRDF